MNTLANFGLIIPLLASGAFGQSLLNLATADVNLSGTSAVTIASASSLTVGGISTIACTVTTAVTSTSGMYLTVLIDTGTTLTVNVYSSGNTAWHTDVLPWAHGSNGANVGDSFVIPFNNGNRFHELTVQAVPAGGSGHLRCSVSYDYGY